MKRGDLAFAMVILVMLAAGGGLRLSAARAPIPAAPQATVAPGTTPAPGAPMSLPTEGAKLDGQYTPVNTPPGLPPPGAADTVLQFYHLVNTGRYAAAYDLALENRWQKTGDKTYRPAGLTSRDDFAKALEGELVYEGFVINLVQLEPLGVSPLAPSEQNPATRRELYAITSLPTGLEVDGIYQVPVRGRVMSSCTAYDFFRRVALVHLKGDGGWRVLLPGPLEANGNHYEEWFKNTAR